MDLFITYLEMGENNFKQLLKDRKENFKYLYEQLKTLMPKYGERVLETTSGNKISIASTLTAFDEKVFKPNNINATFFGSYLFHRRVSGVRVCNTSNGKLSKISGSEFINYGTHANDYPSLPYFTSAASIGQTKREIDIYITRLEEAFQHFSAQDPFGIMKKNAELLELMEENAIEEVKAEDKEVSKDMKAAKQQKDPSKPADTFAQIGAAFGSGDQNQAEQQDDQKKEEAKK